MGWSFKMNDLWLRHDNIIYSVVVPRLSIEKFNRYKLDYR